MSSSWSPCLGWYLRSSRMQSVRSLGACELTQEHLVTQPTLYKTLISLASVMPCSMDSPPTSQTVLSQAHMLVLLGYPLTSAKGLSWKLSFSMLFYRDHFFFKKDSITFRAMGRIIIFKKIPCSFKPSFPIAFTSLDFCPSFLLEA